MFDVNNRCTKFAYVAAKTRIMHGSQCSRKPLPLSRYTLLPNYIIDPKLMADLPRNADNKKIPTTGTTDQIRAWRNGELEEPTQFARRPSASRSISARIIPTQIPPPPHNA